MHAEPAVREAMVAFEEQAGVAGRVADQDGGCIEGRHAADSGFKDDLLDATGFVDHQQHVVAMDTGHRLRPLLARGACRHEGVLGARLQLDAVGEDRHLIAHELRQLVHPALDLGEQRIEQLLLGGRRQHALLWEPREHEPDQRPGAGSALADTVSRSDRYPSLASSDGLEEALLPVLDPEALGDVLRHQEVFDEGDGAVAVGLDDGRPEAYGLRRRRRWTRSGRERRSASWRLSCRGCVVLLRRACSMLRTSMSWIITLRGWRRRWLSGSVI